MERPGNKRFQAEDESFRFTTPLEPEADSLSRRVALYVRVSTEEQAKNGHSLEQQIGFLKDYCRGRGWKYARIYQENGVSGSTLDRPKFDLMMFHAERRLFEAIVVYRLDRISRSNLDLHNLVEYLGVSGIDPVSATEPFHGNELSVPRNFALCGAACLETDLSAPTKDGNGTREQFLEITGAQDGLTIERDRLWGRQGTMDSSRSARTAVCAGRCSQSWPSQGPADSTMATDG
jgi:hypothetical protein